MGRYELNRAGIKTKVEKFDPVQDMGFRSLAKGASIKRDNISERNIGVLINA